MVRFKIPLTISILFPGVCANSARIRCSHAAIAVSVRMLRKSRWLLISCCLDGNGAKDTARTDGEDKTAILIAPGERLDNIEERRYGRSSLASEHTVLSTSSGMLRKCRNYQQAQCAGNGFQKAHVRAHCGASYGSARKLGWTRYIRWASSPCAQLPCPVHDTAEPCSEVLRGIFAGFLDIRDIFMTFLKGD